jgi:pseudaminic acid synthase
MSEDIFFVAEISANHNQDLGRALELIDKAYESGASAVKFQTYTPETMTLNTESFSVSREHELWGGRNLYDLYKEAMTPWSWHEELFSRTKHHGLTAFSSPFDRTAVDFLEKLECPIYKIASLENGDTDLIEYAANTGKPLIISTGASELCEINRAVEAAYSGGCTNLTLLVCTSSYPAVPKEAHVRRIETLQEEFGVPVGLSDHTLGIGVALAAITLGATVIEKHLTLSRCDAGPDSAFSLEPTEFQSLVNEGRNARESLGSSEWRIQESESESRRLRRSLYIVKDVNQGDEATQENISSLRPNQGGPIYERRLILGRRFNANYTAGTAATLDCVE